VCKRYPLGRGRVAWAFGRFGAAWTLACRSAAAVRNAGRGVRSCTRLNGDDFLSGPDLKCEGEGLEVDNGEGGRYTKDVAVARRCRGGSRLGGRRGARPAARWEDQSWNCSYAWAKSKQEHLRLF
jgi:hypothetical protein